MRTSFRIALAAFVASLTLSAGVRPAAAQTPAIQLSGRVVEAGTGTAVVGAAIEVRGVAERVTDERGEFRFGELAAGPYTLRVGALGYERREFGVVLRADTTLVIELGVDPLRLDSIRADARLIDVRGRVTDARTGLGVANAEVYVGPGRETVTRVGGSYRLRRMPEGFPTVIEVRALAYLPARVTVVPEEGGRVDIVLETDSVGLRMIALQVERLERRVNSIATSLQTINRATLERAAGPSLREVVAYRLPYNRQIQCLIVDEAPFTGGDLREVLSAYLPEEIERVEILARGRMVRVYTRAFMQRMIRGRAMITPIVWGFGGCH